jgi:hypothetical protein
MSATDLKAKSLMRGAPYATWLLGESYGGNNWIYQWDKVAIYDYRENTASIKFRNNNCFADFYYISQKLLPDQQKIERIYNPDDNQSIENISTNTNTIKVRAKKSYSKYNDCYDSVAIKLSANN